MKIPINNKPDPEVIREYGVWILRIILVIGAIVSGYTGHIDVAEGCIAGLVFSFLFL